MLASKAFKNLSGLTLVLAFCVVVLGAWVRLTDAGLGCPDWPGCYGEMIVPDTAEQVTEKQWLEQRPLEPEKGWKEMIHRYFAGTLGLLIAVMMFWALKARYHDVSRGLTVSLSALVIFQAALGMWTVTLLLKPVIVMGHLLGGMTLLSMLAWHYLGMVSRATVTTNQWRGAALIGLVILAIQIALGGWTSSNYAALSCVDFPTCQGSWWPDMDMGEAFTMWRGLGINYEYGVLDNTARVTIHWMHRLGALVTFLYLGWLGSKLLKVPATRIVARFILGLLLLQVILGILNVLMHLPLAVAVAHNGVAALLLLSVVHANQRLWQKS